MLIKLNKKTNLWSNRNLTLWIWWTAFVLIILAAILLLPFAVINFFDPEFAENAEMQRNSQQMLFIFLVCEIFLINSILIFSYQNVTSVMFAKTMNSMNLYTSLLNLNKKFIFIKRTSKTDKQKNITESKTLFNDWYYDTWKANFPVVDRQIKLLEINRWSFFVLNIILVSSLIVVTQLSSWQTFWIIYSCIFAIFLISHYIWMAVASTKAYQANAINKKSWIISLIPIVNLLVFHSSLLKD